MYGVDRTAVLATLVCLCAPLAAGSAAADDLAQGDWQVSAGVTFLGSTDADFASNVSVRASDRIPWIDVESADGTPAFDGFELSVGWRF